MNLKTVTEAYEGKNRFTHIGEGAAAALSFLKQWGDAVGLWR
jgi:hypothetical protein